MKRPRWWIIYKIAIILVMVVAVILFLVDVALGIGLFVVLGLLWWTQARREASWHEERRHRETLEAMGKQTP